MQATGLIDAELGATSTIHRARGCGIMPATCTFADMVAYTTLLTVFSNSADEQSQGWVMGIARSAMALAWAATGLMTNLVPALGFGVIFVIGAMCVLMSAWLMTGLYRRGKRPLSVEGLF
jgi:hypothetical protein